MGQRKRKERKRLNIWTNYRETFPKRYLEQGAFDETVENHVIAHQVRSAIDIGGGAGGTDALRLVPDIFLLDPFVDCPLWMQPTTWDAADTAELVVARGSANYLTNEEIAKIPGKVKPGGWFLANTFFNPPGLRTQTTSTLDGREVTETVCSVASGSRLIHRLDFPDGKTQPIIHTIRIIPEQVWKTLLPGVEIHHRGKSATLRWQKA